MKVEAFVLFSQNLDEKNMYTGFFFIEFFVYQSPYVHMLLYMPSCHYVYKLLFYI